MKRLLRAIAAVVLLPMFLSFAVRRALLGGDRAFQASWQWLSLVPGLSGEYLRRAFLSWIADCGPDVVIGFGTLLSTSRVTFEVNAYIGPHCDLGWVHVERDVMIAAGVHVPSGPHTHGTARVDVPMRDQPGDPRQTRIGAGAWLGNAAVVLADVGPHAIVAAGAVVTKPVPAYAIVAGVPARIVRSRLEPGTQTT